MLVRKTSRRVITWRTMVWLDDKFGKSTSKGRVYSSFCRGLIVNLIIELNYDWLAVSSKLFHKRKYFFITVASLCHIYSQFAKSHKNCTIVHKSGNHFGHHFCGSHMILLALMSWLYLCGSCYHICGTGKIWNCCHIFGFLILSYLHCEEIIFMDQ